MTIYFLYLKDGVDVKEVLKSVEMFVSHTKNF